MSKSRENYLSALAVFLIVIACCGILAYADGTTNKTWTESFQVYDATGTGRTNCAGSRFSLKLYRDGAPVALAATYRNFTTAAGDYAFSVTPAAAGSYSGFLTYSGAPIGTFQAMVRAYDVDTQYAAQAVRYGNLSTVANRRPTNPLLATDSRIPATVVASSAEVAKASDWTSGRAGKVDNLDAAVTSRAPASTALSSATWTAARAGKVDNLDVTVSSRATGSGGGGTGFINATGIEQYLAARHGSGLWTADGQVVILPFQGAVSYETAVQGKDVHVVKGDSVSLPYSTGTDITGWTVWFGAKANPSDSTYTAPLREITGDVTDAAHGGGLIKLSTADTAIACRRYFAEVEIRKAGQVNTALKFYLWIDADVIR